MKGPGPSGLLLVCSRTGTGKALLTEALRGLLDRRDDLSVSGEVVTDGDLGYVFQRPAAQLVRRTVRSDVAFGLENRAIPPDEIRALVDAYADRLGASDLLDRRVDTLSGGETAIVALLGVLVTEPDAIILDEPLAALDAPSTRRVLEAIDRIRADDTTLVIAEHDCRDLLSRADRVLLLEDGRTAATGAPESMVDDLHQAGIRVPFGTAVAIERRAAGEPVTVPLGPDGS
jgi:energy-coupling factor transporter ATP-binding protein EcfA2